MARLLSLFLLAGAALGQWEAGAVAGYGWYRDGTIFGPGISAAAGVRDRYVAGVTLSEQPHDYLAGEFRYLFHDGDAFLEAGGVRSNIQTLSHTLTYELLVYLRPGEARVLPFLAGGGGVKGYIVSGPAPVPQPVSRIGTLETNDVWKLVFSMGGGVKFRLRRHLSARVEFRDYLTTFPRTLIAPAANNTARGIFQQFTPMFGLSYVF
jgi:opacity protein-like surface antigen